MFDTAKEWLDWLGAERGRLTRTARALKIGVSHLSHIRRGRRVPSLRLAKRIHELAGVPLSAWITEAIVGDRGADEAAA